MRAVSLWIGSLVGLCVACGGGEKQPAFPPVASPEAEEVADESWDTGRGLQEQAPEEEVEEKSVEPKAPEFTTGMSVEEAISAVPSHYDYVGLDPEVLTKPLKELGTYEGCKVKMSDHFKVRIAVWDGKVVGADVSAKGRKKLAQCIDDAVRKLEYKEKEQSINTVEYSF